MVADGRSGSKFGSQDLQRLIRALGFRTGVVTMKNTLGACLLGITVLEHIVTHGGETYQLNGTRTSMQIVLRYFEL